MKSGGQIPWNAIAICSMSQTSWQTGNLNVNEDFGNHSKDQLCYLSHWLDIFSERDKARIQRFGRKLLRGIIIGYALIAGTIWKGDILIADIEELVKLDASEIYPRRLNAKEVLITRDEKFVIPTADVSATLSGRSYEFQEPTLRREPTARRENLSGEYHGDWEEVQPEETKDDAEAREHFWSIQGDFIYRHHIEPRSSILRVDKRIISYSTELYWCHQVNLCRSVDCTRRTTGWILGCWQQQKYVRVMDWISQDLRYWTKLLKRDVSNPGWDWREFKRHHIQITYGPMQGQELRKQSRNCYSMRKTVFPNMHTGNRCSKITRAEVSEDKTHLYWYCIGKRNSEKYYSFTHEFVPMKGSQESSSPNFRWRWKQAHVVSSRDTAYLWDEILQVNLQIREYEILSRVNLGRKKYKLRMLICPPNLGSTHECGGCTC